MVWIFQCFYELPSINIEFEFITVRARAVGSSKANSSAESFSLIFFFFILCCPANFHDQSINDYDKLKKTPETDSDFFSCENWKSQRKNKRELIEMLKVFEAIENDKRIKVEKIMKKRVIWNYEMKVNASQRDEREISWINNNKYPANRQREEKKLKWKKNAIRRRQWRRKEMITFSHYLSVYV